MLTKITAEAALNAELDEHLGYQKPEITAKLIILLWNCPYISTFRLT